MQRDEGGGSPIADPCSYRCIIQALRPCVRFGRAAVAHRNYSMQRLMPRRVSDDRYSVAFKPLIPKSLRCLPLSVSWTCRFGAFWSVGVAAGAVVAAVAADAVGAADALGLLLLGGWAECFCVGVATRFDATAFVSEILLLFALARLPSRSLNAYLRNAWSTCATHVSSNIEPVDCSKK